MHAAGHDSTGVHPDRLALISGVTTSQIGRQKHRRAEGASSPNQIFEGDRFFVMPPQLKRAKKAKRSKKSKRARRGEVRPGWADADNSPDSGKPTAIMPGMEPPEPPSPFLNSAFFADWRHNEIIAGNVPLASLSPATNSLPNGRPSTDNMGAQKRMGNGEPKAFVGPHPSFIRVSAQYQTQAAIDSKLQQPDSDHQERSIAEAKEDSLRLQGVQWIDVVRRALSLPIRTYTTACTYYHKFRLAHPPGTPTGDNYLWSDAAAASLLTACKMEDTLKKSRDILAASHNLKAASAHDHLPSDDPSFEQQSRAVIGLERMVLEASTFDFRSRSPHSTLAKLAKTLGGREEIKAVYDIAWTALTDIYRTFAPLKQISATLALAMLELAARLTGADNIIEGIEKYDLSKVSTTRAETMETILDSLDLYIQHTTATTLGTRYSLDEFLRLRLALKKECDDNNITRNCVAPTHLVPITKVQNGHPTPISPAQNESSEPLPAPVILEHAPPVLGGTLRFMLNPKLAHDEREVVDSHFKEEWEEYEEEIEVPLPRAEKRQGPPSSRASSRDRREERDRAPLRTFDDRREERARVDRERAFERDSRRPPPRERERDGRDSRRYDDERRPYPESRDNRRYEERRYDDRRREERRYPRDDRR
jgi:CTD kinase subunit beta